MAAAVRASASRQRESLQHETLGDNMHLVDAAIVILKRHGQWGAQCALLTAHRPATCKQLAVTRASLGQVWSRHHD